jgi:16S rRNA (cytidine1402-2'-O)-methyltransferase
MHAGKLIVVPTPIGNLDDITLRAIKTLRAAQLVLCEDTRTTGILLKHLDIKQTLASYHKFNEHHSILGLIQRLQGGDTIALVSDAGTPSISDPGFLLVRACVQAGVQVECLPGATAFVPALVKSGLPSDRFCFEGFLPPKKGRQTRLTALSTEVRTIVFYESPHRILKTLQELPKYMGDQRQVSVSREITKLYEETFNGTLHAAAAFFAAKPSIKGEFVVVLAGSDK